jgi:hypothetical protein
VCSADDHELCVNSSSKLWNQGTSIAFDNVHIRVDVSPAQFGSQCLSGFDDS